MFIARKLTDYLALNKKIPFAEKEIFRYGFEIIISIFSIFITIIILGNILFERFDGLIFTLFFFAIRIFSGGGHAKRFHKCFLYTNITFSIVATLAKFVQIDNVVSVVAIMLICYYTIYKLSIKGSSEGNTVKKVKMNKKNLIYMMFANLIHLLILFIASKHYFTIAVYSTVILSISQLITNYYEQRRKITC